MARRLDELYKQEELAMKEKNYSLSGSLNTESTKIWAYGIPATDRITIDMNA